MRLFHTPTVVSAVFDEPNLVSAAGLVPVMALAQRAGLGELAQARLSVPSDKGANAGAKICSLVAGMAAGADSIDDMGVLRHGAMGKVLGGGHAPSTLGSFLRAFTFGHVRQLDAVASRFLRSLAAQTGLLGAHQDRHLVMVDIDDTIVECLVPGLMEALNPREDESHGSTEEVPRGASGASDPDGGRRAA